MSGAFFAGPRVSIFRFTPPWFCRPVSSALRLASGRIISVASCGCARCSTYAAKYVCPYSRGQKNDFRDVEAIAEAVQCPTTLKRRIGSRRPCARCRILSWYRRTRISTSSCPGDLKRSPSMRTNRRPIAIIRRSRSDSSLAASQRTEFSEATVARVSLLTLFTCATAARAPVVLVSRSSVTSSSSRTGVRARSV
jgi:hypothetical protein